jgi:mannose-6-phosphate isomerase-like protein (cupin superfamily)
MITTVAKVNISEKLAAITDHWSPRIAGEVNGQHIKLVKVLGAFAWHTHEDADEMFLVVRGRFCIELRDSPAVELAEGEFAIVPRGVEHRPVAESEAEVLVFEPAGTVNTGAERNQFTVEEPATI